MKTYQTEIIEKTLIEYFYLSRQIRCGLEVALPYGKRVDFLGIHRDGEIICVEIKVSKADFNSKNGHNFVGHKNYYAVPKDLADYAKKHAPKNIGVISIDTTRHVFEEDKKIIAGFLDIVKTPRRIDPEINSPKKFEWVKQNIMTSMASTTRRLYDKYLYYKIKEEIEYDKVVALKDFIKQIYEYDQDGTHIVKTLLENTKNQDVKKILERMF